MSLKEGTMVKLHSKDLGGTFEFDAQAAENILNDPKNTPNQWALPANSNYKFTRGKIVVKSSTDETDRA